MTCWARARSFDALRRLRVSALRAPKALEGDRVLPAPPGPAADIVDGGPQSHACHLGREDDEDLFSVTDVSRTPHPCPRSEVSPMNALAHDPSDHGEISVPTMHGIGNNCSGRYRACHEVICLQFRRSGERRRSPSVRDCTQLFASCRSSMSPQTAAATLIPEASE